MLIVFNPTAGRARASLLWRVLDVMVENGVRIELAETRRPGHAEALARDAATARAPIVVAAGGDGTIAEVASGLLGSQTRLGVIPLGTANVLAHELALPFSGRAVAAALVFGRTRTLWPGLASGANGKRIFVQMLGVGFDAQVVHQIDGTMKRSLGRSAYLLQGLREVARYDFAPIAVRIDEAETRASSVIVSKGRLYGGHHLLAPQAQPAQPGFSVALFDHGGPAAAMLYGAALPLGLLARLPGIRHLRAHRIEIASEVIVPAQSDGDAAGCTPLSITDAPAPIQIVVG
jgi:YegS/Rv2252/BmrU family lipid kinase